MTRTCLITFLALGLAAGEALSQTPGEPVGARHGETPSRQLVAAVHVHSTMSTGVLTLDQLAQRAGKLGIDAIVLSENFALRYEYGLPPFRGLLKASSTAPSVSGQDSERFLTEVAAAQARHPDVLFVPGVEVAPHYYWTGSPLTGELTLHDSQRNLLVLGLMEAEDYRALPAAGNRSSYYYSPASWLNLAPLLLLAPTIWLWRHSRAGRGGRVLATILAGAVVVLLLNAWPFAVPVFSPYDAGLGYQPYQAVIRAATERGGLVFWSLPEARDQNQYTFGPLGTVTVRTEPHPEALLRTTGYTGFGGVYQDTRQITDPGAGWDLALAEYLAGDGDRGFPVAIGEIAFHAPGQASIDLHQVLNVLQVQEWSPRGVLEALRRGRLYAVGQFPPEGVALRLEEFSLAREPGGRRAQAGDTLQLAQPAALSLHVRVMARDGEAVPVSLRVIRSGLVVAATTGSTPLSFSHFEEIGKAVTPAYYRVEVKGRYAEILSNPIFVRPQ